MNNNPSRWTNKLTIKKLNWLECLHLVYKRKQSRKLKKSLNMIWLY